MDIIPYGKHFITEDDIEAVARVLRSGNLTQGPEVQAFEDEFARFVGAKYALAVANGTDALHLCALALKVNSKSKVLVTSNSFVASANCIRYCEGAVEFVDIDPKNYCLDLIKLEKILLSAPRGTYQGVVCVDFAGYPANLEKLKSLTQKHGLWIIEDSCHALGGAFQDSQGVWQSCGNGQYADLAIFSFHPVKHLATGEGGMITTNDPVLFEKIKLLRTHGITKDPQKFIQSDGPWYYEMQELGYNYRVPDILCALGRSQLKRLDSNLKRRKEIAQTYQKELGKFTQIELPKVEENVHHAYHLYVIQTDRRLELYNHLKDQKIYTQVHYIPIYRQPYYEGLYGKQSFEVMDHYYSRCLSLPMYHSLTHEEQMYVIQAIKDFIQQ